MEDLYKLLKASSPIAIQIKIAEKYNNSCLYYNHWRCENNAPSSLSLENAKKLIDYLVENEIFDVTITGGEPLLNLDVVRYLIKELRERGISFSLNSNLRLMTAKVAKELKELGLLVILTSFLSCDEQIHNLLSGNNRAWSETVNGIKIAKENGFTVAANVVLTRSNYEGLYSTAKFLSSFGIKIFQLQNASSGFESRY